MGSNPHSLRRQKPLTPRGLLETDERLREEILYGEDGPPHALALPTDEALSEQLPESDPRHDATISARAVAEHWGANPKPIELDPVYGDVGRAQRVSDVYEARTARPPEQPEVRLGAPSKFADVEIRMPSAPDTSSPMLASSARNQQTAERLKAARARAAQMSFGAEIARAGDRISAGLSGLPGSYDPSIGKDLEQSAARAVPDEIALIGAEKQDRAQALAGAHEAAMADPLSEVSKLARASVESFGTFGQKVRTQFGDSWDRVSAADLQRVPLFKDAFRDADQMERIALTRERRDPNSAVSQDSQAAFLGLLQARGTNVPPVIEKRIRASSAETIESQWMKGMNAEDEQAFRQSLADQRGLLQEKLAGERTQRAEATARVKAAKEDVKRNDAARAYYLEGYELSPEAKPTNKETESIRKAQAGTRTIQQTVGEIEALFKTYGTEALPTAARARMSSLTTDLLMSMKGDAMYQLGVLSGPDLEILQRVAPDPTTSKANVLDFLGGDQTLVKLQTLSSQVGRRFENSARSLGYRRAGTPTTATTQSAAPARGGTVKVRRKADMVTKTMTAEQAAQFAQDDEFEVLK